MSADVDLRELSVNRSTLGETRRRHLVTRYLVPLVLIAGFSGLIVWSAWDLFIPPRSVKVFPLISTTAEVRVEGTPLFKAAGWIEPRPTPIRVAALAPGVVEKLLVVEDQLLKSGDRIAELVKDDSRYSYEGAGADHDLRKAEVDRAQAALAAAETRLKHPVHLQATLGEAEAALAKISTVLKTLPFELRRAKADHAALKSVYDGKRSATGVVAGADIDLARAKSESAKALVDELEDKADSLKHEEKALTIRRDALQKQLELLTDELKERDEAKANLKAAEAKLDRARVALAEAKLQLDRMTVVAPVDGRVFRLIAQPGARIGDGSMHATGFDGSTVITMYQPEMLQIRVDVRFDDVPKVSLKQSVKIDNPALETPLIGEVLFVSSEADIQKNTLQVKVAIADPPSVFKPEMLVDVTFLAPLIEQPTSASEKDIKLYILQSLIHNDDSGTYVWAADQSAGVARKVAIRTGHLASNGLVEVASGLVAGTRIITNAGVGLKDGERIRITGEDEQLSAVNVDKSDSQ